MVNYLVTGGCGFIGSNYIHHLLRSRPDVQIVNVDALTYAGISDNMADISHLPNYCFEHADIRCRKSMQAIFERYSPQVVVNFAAETHVDKSIQHPAKFIATNVSGLQVLLEVSLHSGVQKFVQISTDEVYGPAENEVCFHEGSPLRPSNPYAASKAAGDLLALAYWKTYKLPVVIDRCTNNYGPRQFPEKFIPIIIGHCLQGQPIPLYGDGRQERDWLYVEDHCAAVDLIIKSGEPGCIYNTAGQNRLDNFSLVKKVVSCIIRQMRSLNLHPHISLDNLMTHVPDRPGHDQCYALDDSRLRNKTGWAPATSLEEGIDLTVAWYLANQDWLEKACASQQQEDLK